MSQLALGAVYVKPNGTFNMYSGMISDIHTTREINNCITGVNCDKNGNFNMYGGKITNVSGSQNGGVYLKGCFEMYGEEISGNSAWNGGGVYVEEGGTFKMYGGRISENSVSYAGGGVVNSGGGVEIHGGKISGNSARDGGGILNTHPGEKDKGVLKIYGGKISDNTASGNGGGITAHDIVEISGGEIFGNSALYGGAIYVNGELTLSRKVQIIPRAGETADREKNDIFLDKEVIIIGSGFSTDTPIMVTISSLGYCEACLDITNTTSDDISDKFVSSYANYITVYNDNKVQIPKRPMPPSRRHVLRRAKPRAVTAPYVMLCWRRS